MVFTWNTAGSPWRVHVVEQYGLVCIFEGPSAVGWSGCWGRGAGGSGSSGMLADCPWGKEGLGQVRGPTQGRFWMCPALTVSMRGEGKGGVGVPLAIGGRAIHGDGRTRGEISLAGGRAKRVHFVRVKFEMTLWQEQRNLRKQTDKIVLFARNN